MYAIRSYYVNYADGEKRYILAPHGLKVGQEIMAGKGSYNFV